MSTASRSSTSSPASAILSASLGGHPRRRGPAAGEKRPGEAGEGAGAKAFHPSLAIPAGHLGGEADGFLGVPLEPGQLRQIEPDRRRRQLLVPLHAIAQRLLELAAGAGEVPAVQAPARLFLESGGDEAAGAGGAGEPHLLAAAPLRLGEIAQPLLEPREQAEGFGDAAAGSSPCRFISSARASRRLASGRSPQPHQHLGRGGEHRGAADRIADFLGDLAACSCRRRASPSEPRRARIRP